MPYSYDRRAARFTVIDLTRFLASKCQRYRQDPQKFKSCCGDVLGELSPTHPYAVLADKLDATYKWLAVVEKARKESLATYG